MKVRKYRLRKIGMMQNERAVSPVIGTVLLVAITVILGSMTTVFMLGALESMSQDTPLTTFSTESDGGNYTITHMGGDTVDSEDVYVLVGDEEKRWSDYPETSESVRPSDSITIVQDVSDGEELSLVYSEDGYSSVLHQSTLYSTGDGEGSNEPSISSFSAENPSGQDLEVSFNSDKSLSTIGVEITGEETATLTRDNFNRNGNTYTATYQASSDGDYTAKLDEAIGADGNNGAGGQSDTATVSTSVLNSQGTVVYSGVEALSEDEGERVSIGVDGVDALGPPSNDITGDGDNDLPYVNDGELRVTDGDGGTRTLVSDSSSSNPDTDKTRMAVGSWQGSSNSVFYVNENHDTIYRVDSGGSVNEVATLGNGANAVLGIGDIDGDSDEELIFADASQQVRYLESDGGTEKVQNGGVGSNNGIGVGDVADFDGDGTVRFAMVDGSNNVVINGVSESEITFTQTNAKKTTVTVADVDADGGLEVVYVDSGGDVRYVDDPLGSPQLRDLTDSDGNTVTADGSVGVVSG